MKNHTLLSGINYSTVQKLLIFFDKLLFFCKLSKSLKNLFINLFSSVIICERSAHRNRILCNAVCCC